MDSASKRFFFNSGIEKIKNVLMLSSFLKHHSDLFFFWSIETF